MQFCSVRAKLTLGALLLLVPSLLIAQTVNLTSLTFSAQFGGQPVSQTLNIASSSATTFTAASNVSWLKLSNGLLNNVSTVNGTTPATITVTADPTGLNPGQYSGSISIYGTGPAVIVQVSLTVGAITVNPASLDFAYTVGGAIPAAQSLALSGQGLGFTAASSEAWLKVSPATGTTPASLAAQLDATAVAGLAAGSYSANITITPGIGSQTATPVTVPVTLKVTLAPQVTFSAGSIALAYQYGGANNQPQTFTMATSGSQDIGFTVTSSADANPAGRSWILVNPSTGTIPRNGSIAVTVSYDTTASLPAGTYTGKITVLAPGASPAQKDIPVQLTVSSLPALIVPATPLKFVYQLGGAAPAPQNVTVQSTGAAPDAASGQLTLAVQGSQIWISAPATGITGTPIPVTVNPSGLPAGSYSGVLTFIASASNSPQTANVMLTVSSDAILQSNVSSLAFPYQIGQTASAQLSQTVSLTSNTGAPLSYAATAATTGCGNSWLTLSGATTGLTSGSFTVVVNPAGLSAGTCDGAVTVTAVNPATGVAAVGTPLHIPVSLVISNSAALAVSPLVLSGFTGIKGGAAPAPQTVNLYSTTAGTPLTYSVTTVPANCGANWLFISKTTGTTPDTLAISVTAPADVQPGTCTGVVRIAATGAGGAAVADSPVSIPVTFQVASGTLTLGASSLAFTATLGQPAPAAQAVAVTSSGSPLVYAALASNPGAVSWLSVSPSGGTTSAGSAISVSVDGSKLTPGTYQGTVAVSSPDAANSPANVTVTLTLNAGTIAAGPASLSFLQAQGAQAPASQKITVTTSPGTIDFTATVTTQSGGSWLSVSAPSGGVVQVTASGGSLSPGTYKGTVTIAAAAATGSPIAIPVTLTAVPAQTLTLSAGSLDFGFVLGTSAPSAKTLQLTSSGGTAPFSVTVSGTSSWLQVSPASGTTPATLAVSINPQGLTANTYTGTITIASPYSVAPVNLVVTLAVAAVPQPVVVAIKNAASWLPGAVAPGENVVIGGTGIGPATIAKAQFSPSGGLATTIGETQVLFDNTPAPIIYAWATQTAVMVPYEIAGRPTTSIRVVYRGVASEPVVYNVTAAAPGIYTLNQAGSGPPVVLNLDGASTIARGATIAFYMTGEGLTSPGSTTGMIAGVSTGLNKPVLQPVTATVGGVAAKVAYAGSAPGAVYGVMQVNVDIPRDAPTGVQPVIVSVGGISTQAAVTVTLQ